MRRLPAGMLFRLLSRLPSRVTSAALVATLSSPAFTAAAPPVVLSGPRPPGGTQASVSLGDDSGGHGDSENKLVPPNHTVRKGDTLWDVCDHYFSNPWQWPRIWSYNPEILNPHWIYPGELVRLQREGAFALGRAVPEAAGKGGMTIRKTTSMTPGTIFLRNQGLVYDDKVEDIGEIVGSPEERMLLAPYNRVYIRVSADQAKGVQKGAQLTIFQNVRPVKRGSDDVARIVQILGTVTVDHVDTNGLLDATIVEGLDAIERGARVGPIERKIDIVAPLTNQVDLRGTVLASLHPNVLFGQNHVVFLDKGEDQGLHPGNRVFVVRRGDPWRQGLASAGALTASKVTLGTDGPATVKLQDTAADSPDFPEEVVAEIRILRVRGTTSTGLVTTATRELEPGDIWVAKNGY